MTVKLLTEHHLEFLSLKGGCTGLSESTLVKMPHCWESYVAAQMYLLFCELLVKMLIALEPLHIAQPLVCKAMTRLLGEFEK